MSKKLDNIIKAELLASWKETLQGWHDAEKQVLSTMQRVRIWVEEHGLSELFIKPKKDLDELQQRQLTALMSTAASVYGWDLETRQGKNAAQQFKSRIKKLLLEGEMAIAYRSKEQRKQAKRNRKPSTKVDVARVRGARTSAARAQELIERMLDEFQSEGWFKRRGEVSEADLTKLSELIAELNAALEKAIQEK